MRSIEERIETLERSNRRLKLLAGLLLAGTATTALMGAGERAERPDKVTVKEIDAETFNVVKDGKTLAVLGAGAEVGSSSLMMMKEDHPIISVAGGKDGGRVSLFSPTDFLHTRVTIDGNDSQPGMKILTMKDGQPYGVMAGVLAGEAGVAAGVTVQNGEHRTYLPPAGR